MYNFLLTGTSVAQLITQEMYGMINIVHIKMVFLHNYPLKIF